MLNFYKIERVVCSIIIILSFGLLASFLDGCATDLVGDPADLSKFESPVGMAIHPNGRYAYVTGANFDLNYRANDGGVLYVIDLEKGTIMPSSKRMGSFGTNIVLTDDARRGYTVTRYDDALVWFDISSDGSTISCPEADEDSESLNACRVIVDDAPTYVALAKSYRETKTLSDSGNVVLKHVDFDLLMVAQLRNARVTAVTVKSNDGDVSFSYESAALFYGASEIQWIGGERFVVTGRSATNLQIISPAINESGNVMGLYARESLTVPSGKGLYVGRGMTTDPTGRWLYLINQLPNALLQFDLSGVANDDMASDKAANTNMLLLPASTTKAVWVGDNETGVIYLSSVVEDSIYIVDPRKWEIVSSFETGDGPYEMIVRDNMLYVLHFLEESITSFDISDPLNPTDKKVIIGNSVSDQVQDK